MGDVVRLPLPQGTRVRVSPLSCPSLPDDCREGIVWQHHPENGGYLVQHDKSPFSDGLFADWTLFGWTYDELEPVRTP